MEPRARMPRRWRGVGGGVDSEGQAVGAGVYIMPQFHRYDLVAEIIEKSKA